VCFHLSRGYIVLGLGNLGTSTFPIHYKFIKRLKHDKILLGE
jgi:hypothetical protein